MSYADDIRGALAAVSGVSRRVQALHDLGLPEADEDTIRNALDVATDIIIDVQGILRKHGVTAQGLALVAASAGQDKSWRESVYGGKKDSTVTVMPKRTTTKSATEVPAAQEDLSHPWREKL